MTINSSKGLSRGKAGISIFGMLASALMFSLEGKSMKPVWNMKAPKEVSHIAINTSFTRSTKTTKNSRKAHYDIAIKDSNAPAASYALSR